MLEDIAKNIPQAIPLAAFTQIVPEDFFRRRYEDVKGIEERFQAKGEGYKKYVNGAIRTMSEMLSQYVGTAGLGTLPSMSAGAGIDKYQEARKEGYSIPRSFAAGGVTTATEYVTEKTPLEILGRPGLKFVDRLMKGLIADVPGEIEATLVEMTTVDQAILGKSHTRQEYLGALLDTAATAALTTFGATGVTHPFTRGAVNPPEQSRVGTAHPTETTETKTQGEQTQQAQADTETQQTPEIRQSAKEEVPGVKPEEYATTQQKQEGLKATLSDEEVKAIREKIKSPEVVSFIEMYKGYLEKEPERVLGNHKEVFYEEFWLEGKDKVVVKTPIEEIAIMPKHYEKLEKHTDVFRKEYIKYIKPTLENPNEVREFEDEHIYIKAFKDGKVKLHTAVVVVKKDGTFYATNVPLSNVNKWEKAIKKGNLLYSIAQKPAKEVAPSSPGANIISPSPESVKSSIPTKIIKLYHGTPQDFEKFDFTKSNHTGEAGGGFYLTTEKKVARLYKGGTPANREIPTRTATIKEYYLKPNSNILDIDKPLDDNFINLIDKNIDSLPVQSRFTSTGVRQNIKYGDLYRKGTGGESLQKYFGRVKGQITIRSAIDALQRMNYDYNTWQIPGKILSGIYDGLTFQSEHPDEKIPNRNYVIYNLDVLMPVEPVIQLMAPLQNLVDNSMLSLEDALEINDVARQNNWAEDTVKQFYENAVGVGIQNKDTASLERMLVTAKIKEAAYKQNAEKYKQELAETEAQIERLAKLLKIEGGAPDKYEDIINQVNEKVKSWGNLEPEEMIRKAQEELALNLNNLSTDMDVKTLIAATVKTINEAEGISKEVVTHEQTVREAMKELPTIYSKVLNLERGEALTRQQQLAARILGTGLFETFNKTKIMGMADPKNTELAQKAMTQLIELGQYCSKVLASSSEMGRELEAQKIIAKVGEDIPATEEFQKVLEVLSGQKEISPEQFYALTGALKTPEQLAEMAREMARPVTRRIQDVFLEAWINGLLSNPQTHAVNILSNLYTTFASIPERYLAAKTHYGDKPGVVDGEAKAMLFGMQMGFRDAVNAARIVWATETGRFGKTAQKVENAQQKAISAENINRILGKFGVDPMNQTLSNAVDYVGKIWRLPTRALMTADEFFKMINYRMELQALAYRQAAMEGLTGDAAGAKIAVLMQKPTTEMRARAMAHANIQTFTGEMGPVATAVSGITERVPMAKIIVPFVRTPSNIFTYSFERTPFLAYARGQIRADIKAGGAARDMALGKMAFGGMIAGMAATLAVSGFITGGGPEDRELKKMMRDNGWQPYSIRIGNTYYSYKRLDSVGMIIGMVADTVEIMGSLDDYNAGKIATAIGLSMEHNLLDNLYRFNSL